MNNHIQDQEMLMKQINELHKINQNPIDLIRKTISQNDAVILFYLNRINKN